MADVHNPEVRSRNMSAIRGKNTKPELHIRRLLHSKGFRFRLNRRDLPGKPDIVLPRYKAAIMVHGCFWHVHKCAAFHWPASRTQWWKEKLTSNQKRDLQNSAALAAQGWRIAVVWECSIKGKYRLSDEELTSKLTSWLTSGTQRIELRGLQ
ncbi:DNA mismatch endonuclease Vsr [Pseudomaricurvus sp. HS19]|uniref:very short patch repair endonuclease n=1 Tax=Pseudomaricurvus sp. HS19 TaxID=2692626 RepID=UPI00136BDA52|nr:DNA mismatch endonuclease Vsr [Pseudomaricurvus sp. HS19]